MKKKKENEFIRNALIEMHRMLSDREPICAGHFIMGFGPLYEGVMYLGDDTMLLCEDFVVCYSCGVFNVSFSFAPNPKVIATVMQKLSTKFKLEVDEPFYRSPNDGKTYHGDDGRARYLADIAKQYLAQKEAESLMLRAMANDQELKN